jgi:hypothetical protein
MGWVCSETCGMTILVCVQYNEPSEEILQEMVSVSAAWEPGKGKAVPEGSGGVDQPTVMLEPPPSVTPRSTEDVLADVDAALQEARSHMTATGPDANGRVALLLG